MDENMPLAMNQSPPKRSTAATSPYKPKSTTGDSSQGAMLGSSSWEMAAWAANSIEVGTTFEKENKAFVRAPQQYVPVECLDVPRSTAVKTAMATQRGPGGGLGLQGAADRFRRSLAMADAQLGCWHPNTISAAADLGACLSALGESGDWAEAEHVLKRVFQFNAQMDRRKAAAIASSSALAVKTTTKRQTSSPDSAASPLPSLPPSFPSPSQDTKADEEGTVATIATATTTAMTTVMTTDGNTSSPSSANSTQGVLIWSEATAAAAVALADMLRRARRPVEAVPLARTALHASIRHAQKDQPARTAATTSAPSDTSTLALATSSSSNEVDASTMALTTAPTTSAEAGAAATSAWALHERTPEVIRAAKLLGACLLQASKMTGISGVVLGLKCSIDDALREAEGLFRRCAAAEEALFGEEHSHTRSSKSYLVQVLLYSDEHSQATAGCAPRKAEALRLAEDVTRPLSPIATASSSQTPVKAKKTNDNFSSSSSSNATQTTLSPHQHQQALSPRTPQSARQKKVAATSDGGRCEDASKTNKDGGPSFWLQFLFPEQPRTLPAQMQVLALAAPIGVALLLGRACLHPTLWTGDPLATSWQAFRLWLSHKPNVSLLVAGLSLLIGVACVAKAYVAHLQAPSRSGTSINLERALSLRLLLLPMLLATAHASAMLLAQPREDQDINISSSSASSYAIVSAVLLLCKDSATALAVHDFSELLFNLADLPRDKLLPARLRERPVVLNKALTWCLQVALPQYNTADNAKEGPSSSTPSGLVLSADLMYRFQRWTNQFVCLKPFLAMGTSLAAFVVQHYATAAPATAGGVGAAAAGMEMGGLNIFERLLVKAAVHLAPVMEVVSLVSAGVAAVAIIGVVAAFAPELQTHRTGAKLTFLAVAIVGMPILETLLLALAQSPSFARMTSTSANAVLNGPFTLIGGLERPFAVNFHTTLGDLPCLFSGPQSPSFSCPDGAPAVQLVHWLNLLLACLILAPLAAFAAFTSQGLHVLENQRCEAKIQSPVYPAYWRSNYDNGETSTASNLMLGAPETEAAAPGSAQARALSPSSPIKQQALVSRLAVPSAALSPEALSPNYRSTPSRPQRG